MSRSLEDIHDDIDMVKYPGNYVTYPTNNLDKVNVLTQRGLRVLNNSGLVLGSCEMDRLRKRLKQKEKTILLLKRKIIELKLEALSHGDESNKKDL